MATTTLNMGLTKPALPDLADITVLNTDLDLIDQHDHATNARGVAVRRIQNGAVAVRPVAGNPGHVWAATDTGRLSMDTGTAWAESAPLVSPSFSGGATVASGLTVSSGNVVISTGSLSLTAGAITAASPISGYSLTATTGGLAVTGAGTISGSLTAGGLVAPSLTFNTAGGSIVGGSSYTQFFNNAITVANMTIFDAGNVLIRAGLGITAGGLTVTNGGATINGGIGVTGTSTITGALTVTSTLALTLGNITGGSGGTIQIYNNAGTAVNMTINDVGGVVVARGGLTTSVPFVASSTSLFGTSPTSSMGFYGHALANQVAVGGAATDLGTVITLANNLRTALQANGMVG